MSVQRQRGEPFRRANRGVVLILVLVVVVLLALAAYTFSAMSIFGRRAAEVSGDVVQARMYAESGIEYVRFLLQSEDPSEDLSNNPQRFRDVSISNVTGTAEGRFSVLAPVDGPEPRYGIVNLSGRLNLNALAFYDEEAARNAMLQLPGMTDEIADAILDWIDADDQPREYGAENSYYNGLSPGYSCKNGPLSTLDELLLVRGVTFALLHGNDRNRNGRSDPSEIREAATSGVLGDESTQPWHQWITVHSSESNLRRDRTRRINLNHPELAELFDSLETEFGTDVAKLVVAYRLYGPMPARDDVPRSSRPTGKAASSVSSESVRQAERRAGMLLNSGPRYSVRSLFDLIGIQIGYVDETGGLIQSPWTEDQLPPEFREIEDAVTTYSARSIPGRINVWEADSSVLAGIPGMDEGLAAEIAEWAAGIQPGDDDQGLSSLLTENIVALDDLRRLSPFLTTGGDVFVGQAIGYFPQGSPMCRLEFIVDASGPTPHLISCRELSSPGSGF